MPFPIIFDLVDTDTEARAIRVGAAWSFEIRLLQDDGTTPETLTGRTFAFYLRPDATSAELTLKASTDTTEITFPDPTDGRMRVDLLEAVTRRLVVGRSYAYSWAETTGGVLRPLMLGALPAVGSPAR